MKKIILALAMFVAAAFANEGEAVVNDENEIVVPQPVRNADSDQTSNKIGYWHNYSKPVRFYLTVGLLDIGAGVKVKMSPGNYVYMLQGVLGQLNLYSSLAYLRWVNEFYIGGKHVHGIWGFVWNMTTNRYEGDIPTFEVVNGINYDLNAHIGFSTKLYGPISGEQTSNFGWAWAFDAYYAF